MKTVRATYTFTTTREVVIIEHTRPAHYSPEEWEAQQLQDEGDRLADQVGTMDWHYTRLD